MRGKVIYHVGVDPHRRITPAYAGKSDFVFFLAPLVLDHPRLCGEKVATIATKKRTPGSPPPMRGKDKRSNHTAGCVGITPAYAGKSGIPLSRLSRNSGSPPPMRGKVLIMLDRS